MQRGQWYQATDGRYYCWPDPTPYDHPPAPPPSAAPAPPHAGPQRWDTACTLVAIGGGLVALGSLLPWVIADDGSGAGRSGVAGPGIITLLLGVLTAIQGFTWRGRNARGGLSWVPLTAGIVAALLASLVLAAIVGNPEPPTIFQSRRAPGTGLFVVIIGGIVLIAGGTRLLQAPRAGATGAAKL